MEIETRRPTINVDGGSMAAFCCAPVTESILPAVIVIHEIFGLVPHTEDVACRFAREGYVALAPDLFWRVGAPSGLTDRAAMMRFRQSLDDREMLASLDAAVAYLRDQPFVDVSHIGIVGFCMGGYYAFLEAANNPTLAACADFYGAPMAPVLAAARNLRVPVIGLFGEDDQAIPLDQVRELETVLGDVNVAFEVHTYPGAGHAFFNDTSGTYREEPARDAWQQVLRFFAQHVRRT